MSEQNAKEESSVLVAVDRERIAFPVGPSALRLFFSKEEMIHLRDAIGQALELGEAEMVGSLWGYKKVEVKTRIEKRNGGVRLTP